MGYSVIHKGEYNLPQPEGFVSLARYIFAKDNGKKTLFLELFNHRDEAVSFVTLEVLQTNIKGERLDTLRLRAPVINGGANASFVLERQITLYDDCTDFEVNIIDAEFGGYVYSLKGGSLTQSYRLGSAKDGSKNTTNTYIPVEGCSVKERAMLTRNFKFLFVLCVFFAVIVSLSVLLSYQLLNNYIDKADRFFYNNVEYKFSKYDKDYETQIYVIGAKKSADKISIPDMIEGHKVTHIATNAFKNNSKLTEVSIEGEIEIHDSAFFYCTSLKKVSMPNVAVINASAFTGCTSLTSIEAYNLINIGSFAFNGCTNLQSVKIVNDEKLLKIGAGAFYNCSSLKTVEIDQYVNYSGTTEIFRFCNSLETLNLKNFNYSFTIGDTEHTNTKNLGIASLFGYMPAAVSIGAISSLKEISIEYLGTMPNHFASNLPLTTFRAKNLSDTEVGNYAFKGCRSLKTLDIPSLTVVGSFAFEGTAITGFDTTALTSIGEYAFSKCEKLTAFDISVESEIISIGEFAFSGCTALNSFTLPKKLTAVSNGMFEDCTNLSQVVFGAEVRIIGEQAFSGTGYISVSLPDTITTIGAGAFANAKQLKFVNIPNSVTSIGRFAFKGCIAIEEISVPFIGNNKNSTDGLQYLFGAYESSDNLMIPDLDNESPDNINKFSLTNTPHIAANAFLNCDFIREVVISEGTASIGQSAFSNCKRLNKITIPTSVNIIETNAFYNCYKLFEVYNLSILDITVDSDSNGKAGKYAVRVYNSLSDKPMTKYTYNSFEFGTDNNNNWYLLNYLGTAQSLSLPSSFRYSGTDVTSYEVTAYFVAFNESINSITVSGAVNKIRDNAFYQCTSLTSLSIGKSVTQIGKSIIEGCNNINSLNVPFVGSTQTEDNFLSYFFGGTGYQDNGYASDKKNYSPYSLKTVAVTAAPSIAAYTFYECRYLQTVTLPESVAAIGENAFYYCNSLVTVNLPSNLNSIGDDAFYNCYSLKSIILPTNLSAIGDRAFRQCTGIAKITLPQNIQSVGANAFDNCYSLEIVTVVGTPTINSDAFWGCSDLLEVYDLGGLGIQKGESSHGRIAYYALFVYDSVSTSPLKTAVYDDINFKYNDSFWIAVNYTGNANTLTLSSFTYEGINVNSYTIKSNAFSFSSIEHLVIGSAVTQIGSYAFNYNFSLKTVRFVNSPITQIASDTFYYCGMLKSVELPSGLKNIGTYAFGYCSSLSSIVIPAGVETIGPYAFSQCTSLNDVYNLSNHITVTAGSTGHGYLGFYAFRVNTTTDVVRLDTAVVESYNTYNFVFFAGEWYLVSVIGSSTASLPSSFTHEGKTVSSYVLYESALTRTSNSLIVIPRAVKRIVRGFDNYYFTDYGTIYYEGSSSEWNALTAISQLYALASYTVNYNYSIN